MVVNKANATESLSAAQLRKLVLGARLAGLQPVTMVARYFSTKPLNAFCPWSSANLSRNYRRRVMHGEFRGKEPMAIQTAD